LLEDEPKAFSEVQLPGEDKHLSEEDYLSWNQRTVGPNDLRALLAMIGKQGNVKEKDQQRKLWLNLTPFIDQGSYVVTSETTGDRIWKMFTRLGMRHIAVVDHNFIPIGIITRQDIILATIVK